MNLLLAIFYSNYQEKADASIDHFKEGRNKFLIRLFREYDKQSIGELGKEDVFEFLKEIDGLYLRID